MVDMTEDRINRWKCLFCGSKLKKNIECLNGNGNIIGYSLHCCNCGSLNNFALDGNAIDSMIGYGNKIARRTIKCAVSIDDIGNCKYEDCPFRPKKEDNQDNNLVNNKSNEDLKTIVEEPRDLNTSRIYNTSTKDNDSTSQNEKDLNIQRVYG